jgi:hypothetical protein
MIAACAATAWARGEFQPENERFGAPERLQTSADALHGGIQAKNVRLMTVKMYIFGR